jgi:hypothetical protein
MKLLRKQLGSKKLITAAVATSPFYNSKQTPSTSLDPAWGSTVDFLNVMVIVSTIQLILYTHGLSV